MLAHHTRETEFGLGLRFPTPTLGMVTGGQNPEKGGQIGLGYMARKNAWPTPRAFMHKDATYDRGKHNLGEVVGGQLNPTWVEWLMGWPLGWTDLKPLETDKFQKWLDEHGSY